MHLHRLQDVIARSLGSAARHIGATCQAFRPSCAIEPLAPENRYLRLNAAFTQDNLSFRSPVGYGHATWSGIFDSAYTRPGDYLTGPAGIFFISAQQKLLPTSCVLTTGTVSITRAAAPEVVGINPYGGFVSVMATPVITAWPASILFAGSGAPGDLPGDASVPTWTILLPSTPAPLNPADLITDDRGFRYVISSAEFTSLGWRILAKQAAA